jgi:hypothetical protein
MMREKLIPALILLALPTAIAPLRAEDSVARRLDLRDPGWEIVGEGAVVEQLDGETALRLLSGSATFRGIEFEDGTIEFDLQVTDHRAFAYIYFRMASDAEHEEFYFRSHKSRLPDAIQYAPVYKNRSQWQLYHAAGSTAAAFFPPGEWIPVKVVVEGDQAAVFVGAADEPQLIVSNLAHESQSGYLALRSFMTSGTPPNTYVANFANVVVSPGVVDFDFPPVAVADPLPGQVANWQLSHAFAPNEGDILELPAEILETVDWNPTGVNSNGLLEIERHVVRPEGARRASILARLVIPAEAAMTRRLDLGFSDEVSVFLNGRLLAIDDERYSFNFPRRQGLLTAKQLSLFLPLEAGDNELILAVTDSFGGWGLRGLLH